MNRLTNKEYCRCEDFIFPLGNAWITTKKNDTAIYEKLKSLEDIEEELGIDLITLFKALKDGFYIKYNDKIVHIFPDKHITINFWYKTINVFIPPKFFIDCKKGTDYLSEAIDEEYWFKDYGKTWALTKEELEDEI